MGSTEYAIRSDTPEGMLLNPMLEVVATFTDVALVTVVDGGDSVGNVAKFWKGLNFHSLLQRGRSLSIPNTSCLLLASASCRSRLTQTLHGPSAFLRSILYLYILNEATSLSFS